MFKLWSNIKNNWNACGLDIYLKSGQVIHLDRVWEYKFESKDGVIIYIKIIQSLAAEHHLRVQTLDLTQIVAAVQRKK